MKKIIFSVAIIAAVAAIVIGGTTAYFSDTETSTDNTFTAGAIDLLVDSQCSYNGNISNCVGTWGQSDGKNIVNEKFFSFADLKPGDFGENTISLHVNNNDAYMCAIIDNMIDNDNGLTEPEAEDGDTTGGAGQGELADYLHFFAWADDGDNIWNGEPTLFDNIEGPASDILDGVAYPIYTPQNAPFPGGQTGWIGIYWCFGNITTPAGVLTCDGSGVNNLSQTDSLSADISFYVEQARNNEGFQCPEINEPIQVETVKVGDLSQNLDSWFFYNDTNDTLMTINQFIADGGINDIVTGPGGVGAAQMTLDNGTNPTAYPTLKENGKPRYNIATYRYKDVPLASISSLKYRIYDASVSAETPFLNFNVDFDNSDTWQNRLVMVPVGVVANTWTTVDAIDGGAALWTYSGAKWPIGGSEDGTKLGTTAKTWGSILADYPNAETRSTDSWLGVRVGHPGPVGETGYVDWIEFNGQLSDFEN